MIIKRNKSKEEFSTEKIEKALLSAFISCGYPNNTLNEDVESLQSRFYHNKLRQ